MFRYIQATTDKHCPWVGVPDSAKFADQIASAPMTTVLAISHQIQGIENLDEDAVAMQELFYKGPMYFDIDCLDLTESIKSTQALVAHLQADNVLEEDIWVWATGKKGFHVLLPEGLFAPAGRGKIRNLPLVYREIAQHYAVDHLDMVVYSGGRGRMWRTPNVKRDNGKYKVPLTVPELMALTEESYDTFVSEPRDLEFKYSKSINVKLAGLFKASIAEVRIRMTEAELETEDVSDEAMAKFSANDGCIQRLITTGGDGRSNFNQAALQLGAFIKTQYQKSDREAWMPLVQTMADNATKSTAYTTSHERKRHILGAVNRVFSDKKFGFIRKALFKVIKPCGDCNICNGTEQAQNIEDLDFSDTIVPRTTGYYLSMGEKAAKQLTTFTFEVICAYSTEAENPLDVMQTGLLMKVSWLQSDGIKSIERRIPSDAWNSRSAFLGALHGVSGCSVYASDLEIQKLKTHVNRGVADMTEIQEVPSMGTHWASINNRRYLVYVEPGYSLTSSGEEGTHKLSSEKACSAPNFRNTPQVDWSDPAVSAVITALTKMNTVETMGPILGWVLACFLKPHLVKVTNEFPLLNLYGNAGSGKSKTARIMGYLHGCDYDGGQSPISLENVTPYVLTEWVASSTSIMRVIDECNTSTVNQRTYDKFVGVAKAAWEGMDEAKGALGRSGAVTTRVKLTGPICFMSEQQPEMSALRERTLAIGFSKNQKNTPECIDSFEYVTRNTNLLQQIGKDLMQQSLIRSPAWINKKRDEILARLPARSAYNALEHREYAIIPAVLIGLEFLREYLADMQIPAAADVLKLSEAIILSVCTEGGNLRKVRSRSEIDRLFESLTVMARQPEGSPDRLVSGIHYFVRGNEVLLDVQVIFPTYCRFIKATTSRGAVVRTAQQFNELVSREDYYNDMVAHPDRVNGRIMSLDRSGLRAEGVDVDCFEEM